MEFWGVEVKAGAPVKVESSNSNVLHLSQASLGEVKKDKGNELIPIFLNINGQKLVIGTLSSEKCTHISYDLVLDKDFELSHNWKHGSIYFCGYRTTLPDQFDDFTESDSDFGELPVIAKENGTPEPKDDISNPRTAKPDSSAAKPKVKIVEPNKDDKVKEEDDDDEDDSDEDSDEDDESGGFGSEGFSISEDEDSESDGSSEGDESSDEDTPKKAKQGKKRPIESVIKTPVPEKKAKLVTPQKTGPDGKKVGGHTATPHPSKKGMKKLANDDKSKQQTPKSAGQVVCKSCSKTFNSDNALQSHTKAKHSDVK